MHNTMVVGGGNGRLRKKRKREKGKRGYFLPKMG